MGGFINLPYTPYAPDVSKSASGPAIAASVRQNALLSMQQESQAREEARLDKKAETDYLKAKKDYDKANDPVKKYKNATTMIENAANFITPDTHDMTVANIEADLGFEIGIPSINEIMSGAEEKGFVTPEAQQTYYNSVIKEKYLVPFQTKRKERIAELKAERGLKGKKELKKMGGKGGIRISQDSEGNPIVEIGSTAGRDLTKGTKTGTQKTLLEANATYSDMRSIVSKLDTKYLEIPTKVGIKMTALKEKWKIGKVSKEDKKELKDYTDFRRESISSLNAYIKQITGAAMSEMEAKRLMKAMPTPGLGLLDGDSPTEFKTKLDGVMKSLSRVMARNNYVNKYGLTSFEDIGLDNMDGIIERKSNQIKQELLAENEANGIEMTEQQLTSEVVNRTKDEFGLRF